MVLANWRATASRCSWFRSGRAARCRRSDASGPPHHALDRARLTVQGPCAHACLRRIFASCVDSTTRRRIRSESPTSSGSTSEPESGCAHKRGVLAGVLRIAAPKGIKQRGRLAGSASLAAEFRARVKAGVRRRISASCSVSCGDRRRRPSARSGPGAWASAGPWLSGSPSR